ncbi:unnamed protein product [Closterium sp. NIES-65]|nr:unnamed protein product [Closterium sp. NIES-65]
MATPSVLVFDAEGRAVDFEVWVDDLQLFLRCDRKDGLSLFDLTSGASAAPAADADSTVRSQWATRDAAARLAVRSTFPSTERAHFSQYKSAKTLYDAVVARYSSLATAALSRLMLPYLFPDLAAFPTVADLITHLHTSDTRYRAALPAEFCAKNPPPMYITLYYIVTRLPDSLRSGLAGAMEVPVEAAEGVGVAVGVVAGLGASVAAVEAEAAAAVAVGAEEEAVAAVAEVAAAKVELVEVALRSGAASVVVSASSSSALVRPRPPSSFVSGTLRVSEVGVLVLVPTSCIPATALVSRIEAAALGAGEAAALGASASAAPSTGASALLGAPSAQALHTFTLDSSASRSFFRDRTTLMPLSRSVAVSLADASGGPVLAHFSTVLPCPGAPSGALSGLYLPSFSTNLVSGADPQDGGVDQFTPASQRVTHCTCARTGQHLATFTREPGSSLYTLTTESPPVAESGQVAASDQVFAAASRSGPESAPCSCRLLSHRTLLWHHRLGHPSLPLLRGMASRYLVSGLPRSLPPLPPGPAPTCVPYVEGRQRAAPHGHP